MTTDREDLGMDPGEDEGAIVVVRDLAAYPWVRESSTTEGCRSDPTWPGVTVVAYATTRRPWGVRRYWYVKDTDPGFYGADDWPIEAIDPRTIAPGRPTRRMGRPGDLRTEET
jgi:hypothetical protein